MKICFLKTLDSFYSPASSFDPPFTRTSDPLVKVNSTKVLPRQPCCLGDTEQTGTVKVDPARKFKCTTSAKYIYHVDLNCLTILIIGSQFQPEYSPANRSCLF